MHIAFLLWPNPPSVEFVFAPSFPSTAFAAASQFGTVDCVREMLTNRLEALTTTLGTWNIIIVCPP